MYSIAVRRQILLGIICCLMTQVFSQNLVPNPSFEVFTSCPVNINLGQPLECPPWLVPTGGTSDYFNACHTGGIVGVPNNYFGIQPAHTGQAYAGGLYYYQSWVDYREFLQVQLTSPMVAGTAYTVSLYYSLASFTCPIDKLGILIGNTQVTDLSTFGPLNESPQLELNTGLIDNTSWQLFTDCYVALGGEEWITIGNFYHDTEVTLGVGCPPFSGMTISYIYIDDVSVEAIPPPGPIELGDPQQMLCPGESIVYNFDPGLGDFLWQDGSTSPSYVINSPGVYSVTVSSFCVSVEDTVTVIAIQPPAPIELGADTTLCPYEELLLPLDPLLGDFTWQDGSTDPSFNITEPGIYALTISNACGEVNDEIEVIYYPEPFVAFNVDTIMLCEGETFTLILDPEIGEYFWQDGSEGPVYLVTQPGIYSVTVVNPCGSDYASVVVDYDYEPVVDLGSDITICPQQLPYTFNLTGLPDVEHFLWDDGSTNSTFTINSAGNYGVTVSNDCFDAGDVINVTIEDASLPLLDLGPDLSLCPGEQATIHAGVSGVDFLWQDGSMLDSITINAAGTVILTISNSCTSASDTLQVSLNANPPDANLPAQLSVCAGDSVTIGTSVGGASYAWNTGVMASSITVTVPGQYILTVTNACGIDIDSTEVIDLGTSPVFDLGPDQFSCPGDTVIFNPGLAGNYQWQDGNVNPVYAASAPGEIFLNVTNACGTFSDTVDIFFLDPIPLLNLGPDTSICPGNIVLISPGIPNVNYTWSDGSTGSSFSGSSAGVVFLEISNACGISSDTMVITVLTDVPLLDLGLDFSICPGDSVVIAPGISAVAYLWQDGSTGNTYDVSEAGQIILTISNICGSVSDTVWVAENTMGPSLELGPDISVCAGETVLLSPGVNGVTYLWQDGSTNPSLLLTSSAMVTLQIANSCGIAYDTMHVEISGIAPQVDLGPDTLLCDGESLLLEVEGTTAIIEWQDGSSNPMQLIADAGLYAVTLTNLCGAASDTVMVLTGVSPDPFDLGTDQSICAGDVITLLAPDIATGEVLLWSTGSSASAIDVSNAGNYSLVISNICGTTSDDVTVTVDESELGHIEDSVFQFCAGDQLILNVEQSVPASYLWNTGLTSSQLTVSNPGGYSVTITSDCDQLVENIIVEESNCQIPHIFIPNVFSPNDDNINDVFRIELDASNLLEFQVWIYDRWGDVVFNSRDPAFEWNGDFSGKELQPGVYVYQMLINWQSRSVAERLNGDVTLIR